MKALVVYESMFGNTRKVAEAVAQGLDALGDARVIHVSEASAAIVASADLIVVGGPTHVHGMTRPKSRAGAVTTAQKPGSDLVLEPHAEGPGVREWLAALPQGAGVKAAAFDTRMTMAPFLTGRASPRIRRELRRRGYVMVARPESFLVNGDNHLVAGEEDRARTWGQHLAAASAVGATA